MWSVPDAARLSDDDRRTLEAWVRARSTPQEVVFRSQIILLAAEGLSNRRIAQQLNTSRPTVILWRNRFAARGPAALTEEEPGRGRKQQLPTHKVKQIVEATLHRHPSDATHWSVRSMAAAQGVSPATVQRIWDAHGLQSLFNWIQDLESELWNAGLGDRQFLRARIAFCEEALKRFPTDDDLLIENRKRALAESYYELGETEKSELLYREWLQQDPQWGWGWIGWSDNYRFTWTELRDWNRCEQLLREGLSIAEVRDRVDILERLAELYEEQGRSEEAQDFRRQARRSTAKETSSNFHSMGHIRRRQIDVHLGNGGLPLSEMSNIAATASGGSATEPVRRQKVGRNEPCPCGSGKKFKKCCGA
jgi:transposase